MRFALFVCLFGKPVRLGCLNTEWILRPHNKGGGAGVVHFYTEFQFRRFIIDILRFCTLLCSVGICMDWEGILLFEISLLLLVTTSLGVAFLLA